MASYPITVKHSVGRPTLQEQALEAWATDVAVWVQNYMIEKNRIATGGSISSMVVTVNKNSIELTGSQGLAFALQGRKAGGFPPIKAIMDWITAKGIQPSASANGRTPSLRALAFLIGRKIAIKGTSEPKLRPQNLTAVILSKGTVYQKRIAEDTAREAQQMFIDSFKRKKP